VHSLVPDFAVASRPAEFPAAGTPAGTLVVRAAGLHVHGRTVMPTGAVPSPGEPAVFCRPVATAPVVTRRDGTVLADGWLPDFVRLGELERHLGDGGFESCRTHSVSRLHQPTPRVLYYPVPAPSQTDRTLTFAQRAECPPCPPGLTLLFQATESTVIAVGRLAGDRHRQDGRAPPG
jgi:hypothetical protein